MIRSPFSLLTLALLLATSAQGQKTWEFDGDLGGWTASACAFLSMVDGQAHVQVQCAGPSITLTPESESAIQTARGLVLYARASSNTPIDLRFGSDLEHSIRGTWIRAGERLSQIVIPLDSHPEWSTSSGPIQIDWPELSLGSVYIDRLEFTDRRFRGAWTFHEDGDFRGWRPNETIAAPSVQGGVLQGTVQQTSAVKPRLRSPATLSLLSVESSA